MEINEEGILYSIHREKEKDVVEKNKIKIDKNFDFNEIIKYFDEHREIVINDIHMKNETSEKSPSNIDHKTNFRETPMTYPLNQILYGPPGTGKTYHTVNKALEIILEKEKKGTTLKFKVNDEPKEILKEELLILIKKEDTTKEERQIIKACFDYYRTNNQIEFVTFHQSYGYEDFIEGLAPKLDASDISYEIKKGVFKRICECADENEKISELKNINEQRGFDEVWTELIAPLITEDLNEIEVKMKQGSFYIIGITSASIQYRNKNRIAKTTLSLNTLKKMYHIRKNELIKGGLSNYYEPLLELLLEMGEIKDKPVEKQNYIIIIDEINRGNISKIFGELISLIEESKRIGGEDELKLTLPCSGETFGVPSNLHIIGTMNTADRSIALMDIALRRRFEFEEMMPDAELLADIEDVNGINIKSMFKTINKRIEYLLDRDHQIGHSFFMKLKDNDGDRYKTLCKIFSTSVIPLLQEYFYEDWEKIQIVLGDHDKQWKKEKKKFVQEKKKDNDIFGFPYDEVIDEKKIYVINPNLKDSKMPIKAFTEIISKGVETEASQDEA